MKATKPLDPRFKTSQWDHDQASSSRMADEVDEDGGVDGEEDGEEDREDDEEGGGGEQATQPIVQPLSQSELESFEKREKKKGIIYISRIPHGMTVAKVRHLLGGFGEVDRIYLQDGREKESGEKRTGRQNKSAHFTEGWVEFTNKKVAKATAEMLNAEPIGAASGGSGGGGKGGKKSGGLGMRRWRDEIWTMKYLSGFKWGMLSEQLANERASRASRVRAELSQSAFEQKDYLRKVERARVMRDKEQRRKAREAKQEADPSGAAPAKLNDSKARERTFRQREAIVRDVREKRNSGQNEAKNKKFKATHDDGNSQALQGALAKIF